MTEAEFRARYAAAREGDLRAHEWFARRYGVELEAAVRRRVPASSEPLHGPEDVAQEALLTFLKRLPDFPPGLDEVELRARLFQIAKWRAADAFRRPRRVFREGSVTAAEPETPEPSRGTVTRADDRRYLNELIDCLDDRYAGVLRSCVIEGRSVAETAGELGLEEDSVRKRLSRAREQLSLLAAARRREERGEPRFDET